MTPSDDARPATGDGPTARGLIQWAHQGGARERPSNTLGAFRHALRTGGPDAALELDVHRSRDGELVVIHDRTLERTTNGTGKVRRHTRAQLQELNAAWWWSEGEVDDHRPEAEHPLRDAPSFEDVRVPTLDEVLALRRSVDPTVPVTIEIKDWRAAAPLMDRVHDDPSVTVVSFFDPILWLARFRLRRHPGAAVGFAPAMGYMAFFWLRAKLGIAPRRTRYARLQIPTRKKVHFATPRLIAAAQRATVDGPGERTMAVDVWTIDDPREMAALIELGVDGIMTDRPSVLRTVVADPHGEYPPADPAAPACPSDAHPVRPSKRHRCDGSAASR